jgi:prephenate dehydrogenase
LKTVVIVGVGLIGGSFAKALRAVGFQGRIIGVSSPPVVEEALELGVIDAAAALDEAVPQADLIYLAQPILKIIETLGKLSGLTREDALVTDAGSTKVEIARKADVSLPGGSFLGGHPMAGKETRGVACADPDLFRGRTYLLCPSRDEDLQRPAAQAFTELLGRMGAVIHVVTPEEHDQVVALTSHLPQLASTALSSLLGSKLRDDELAAGGPGLLDMTRLSMSSYEIWADILETNRPVIDKALELYIEQLEQLRNDLGGSGAGEMFRQGSTFRNRLQNRRLQ